MSDIYQMLVENDIDVLQRLFGFQGNATNYKHEWVEGELGSNRSQTAASGTAAVTTVAVVSGDGAKFRAGTIFKFVNSDELLQVVSIATDTLTVTRGVNGTTPAAFEAGAGIRIIAHPVLDNADVATVSRTSDVIRAKNYNYVQYFFDYITVDDVTEKSVFAGVKSELAEQLNARLLRLKRDMDNLIVAGVLSTSVVASTTRIMGGLRSFITGAAVEDASSETIDEEIINTCLEDIWDNGGNPTHMLVSPTQKLIINQLYNSNLSIEREDAVFGKLIQTIHTDFGDLSLVMTRNVEDTEAFIVDASRIHLMPMQGLAFAIEPVPRTGTYTRKMISGHYTMEVRDGTKCHKRIINLATS